MALWGLGTGRSLRRYRRAAAEYRRALAPWQEEADALRALLAVASTFAGATAADEPSVPLQLAPGERVFSVLERVGLVEPRRQPERWSTGYTGFSFRLARGVRDRPALAGGKAGGKKEPGEEAPAAIDRGVATVTDQRIVFHGARRTREWAFANLLGYHNDGRVPVTLFHVSNREQVSGLLYEPSSAEEVHFRLALALAHHNGNVHAFVDHIERQLAVHDAARPEPPELPPAARSALPRSRPRPR
ncbi:MAG: hypothetical protein JOZ04_15800 [Acidimicrobiia bacterium]|nr:hypothetical protein [Acidimicrobiia bacterium]